jgi:hypothetical protein
VLIPLKVLVEQKSRLNFAGARGPGICFADLINWLCLHMRRFYAGFSRVKIALRYYPASAISAFGEWRDAAGVTYFHRVTTVVRALAQFVYD